MIGDIIKKHVKKIRAKDGDVFVIRKWEGFTDEDQASITKAMTNRLGRLDGIVLLFVDNLADVRTLNERQMNNNGWGRLPRE